MFGAAWTQDEDLAAAFRELSVALVGSESYVAGTEAAAAPVADGLRATCLVALLEDRESVLHPLGVHDPRPAGDELLAALAEGPFERSGALATALDEGRVVAAGVAAGDVPSAWSRQALDKLGLEHSLSAPIRGRHQALGVVWAARGERGGAFSEDERTFLEDCARLIGLAVDAGLLEEALDQARGRRRLEVRTLAAPPEGAPERRRRRPVLSERELRVLRQLARGQSNRETASLLGLSVRTIEWHRARLQWKLGVSGRGDLVTAAREQGIEDV